MAPNLPFVSNANTSMGVHMEGFDCFPPGLVLFIALLPRVQPCYKDPESRSR